MKHTLLSPRRINIKKQWINTRILRSVTFYSEVSPSYRVLIRFKSSWLIYLAHWRKHTARFFIIFTSANPPLIAHVIDEGLQASPVFYSTRNSKLCASKCWSVFFVTLVLTSFCSFVCQLTYKLVRLDLHVFALLTSCFSSATVFVESQFKYPSTCTIKARPEKWNLIAHCRDDTPYYTG